MAAKPSIAIIGAGSLGGALALSLKEAGYDIREVISRDQPQSRLRARQLATRVGGRASTIDRPALTSTVAWFCVPDREIRSCAKLLAEVTDWKGKVALHSSGALSSSELAALKKKGASVASLHPLMTFVRRSRPSLKGVPFALEGDAAAVRTARQIVRDLGGESFLIAAKNKPAYHAWGGFTSPLLIAALVTAEQVAMEAGMSRKDARRRMMPIVQQTLRNYFDKGAANAFSGPIPRGDLAVVQKHLRTLQKIPDAMRVYIALARVAAKNLPARNRRQLSHILKSSF